VNSRSPGGNAPAGKSIVIAIEGISLTAELYDTPTAAEILKALPLEGRANRWGDEIYFDIPVRLGLEAGARADVEAGELGYWPTGTAFCIFFGPTPASTDERPRAYSPVNIFGRIRGDVSPLKIVRDGAIVTVRRGGW